MRVVLFLSILAEFFICSKQFPLEYGPTKVNLNVVGTVRVQDASMAISDTATQRSTDSHTYDVFRLKTYGKEEAVREEEGLLSKFDTAYGRAQSLFPKEPIVDHLDKHKDYDNQGGVSWIIGHSVVGGYEILANLINAAIEGPKLAGDKLLKNVNTVLGSIGAKLIG